MTHVVVWSFGEVITFAVVLLALVAIAAQELVGWLSGLRNSRLRKRN